MDRNVVIGIVVVLALLILGWWYWAFMAPIAQAPGAPAPEETAESVPVLIGAWQSTEDSRFVRTFNADGTVIDTYEGDASATATGTWSFITDLPTELPGIEPVSGTRYVKIVFAEEVLYFAITEHTESSLAMIYLGGNGVLEFTRVQ